MTSQLLCLLCEINDIDIITTVISHIVACLANAELFLSYQLWQFERWVLSTLQLMVNDVGL